MLKVSERTQKIVFSLTYLAIIVMAASTGIASEGGAGAHHADRGAQLKDLGWRVLNFAVLLGILGYAIKKADVKGSLAARQAQIEKDLKDAQEGKAAAEAKLTEYRGKLEQATKEIDDLQAAIIREGEQEKERIIAEARIAAQKIAAQAAQSAEQETVKARAELRAEAARLAVDIATGKLTGAIQKVDHDRFVGEYLDKVVQIQ
jgi:F-type H+-transporting ATPase subunit b